MRLIKLVFKKKKKKKKKSILWRLFLFVNKEKKDDGEESKSKNRPWKNQTDMRDMAAPSSMYKLAIFLRAPRTQCTVARSVARDRLQSIPWREWGSIVGRKRLPSQPADCLDVSRSEHSANLSSVSAEWSERLTL